MKMSLIIGSLLLSSAAMAQAPTEYILRVSPAELDVISKGLQTQPFGEVAPLMRKLQAQYMEQQPKPKTEPPKEEKKDEKDGGSQN